MCTSVPSPPGVSVFSFVSSASSTSTFFGRPRPFLTSVSFASSTSTFFGRPRPFLTSVSFASSTSTFFGRPRPFLTSAVSFTGVAFTGVAFTGVAFTGVFLLFTGVPFFALLGDDRNFANATPVFSSESGASDSVSESPSPLFLLFFFAGTLVFSSESGTSVSVSESLCSASSPSSLFLLFSFALLFITSVSFVIMLTVLFTYVLHDFISNFSCHNSDMLNVSK